MNGSLSASRDLIFAFATPPQSLMAVIRTSGFGAIDAVSALCEEPLEQRRGAVQRRMLLSGFRRPLEVALWVSLGPNSATGEDTVELHVLSSPYLSGIFAEALRGVGFRSAEPGEFTYRALRSGRIDLRQAEAVLALIEAEDESERKAAISALDGRSSAALQEARERLLAWRTPIELALDFADQGLSIPLPEDLAEGLRDLRALLAGLARTEVQRAGPRGLAVVVLSGPPNAGKSSLFNRLCGRDLALVSGQPGTTRDPLIAELRLADQAFRLIDLAGEEEAPSGPDAVAQSMRAEHLAAADLVLCVADGRLSLRMDSMMEGPRELRVWTHADVCPDAAGTVPGIWISNESGAGLAALKETLVRRLRALRTPAARQRLLARQAAHLTEALAALNRASDRLSEGDEFLLAADLKTAAEAIFAALGEDATEALLSRIFSEFCIGK